MKSLKILISAFFLLSINSCKNFLDTEPLTLATEENSYRTADDAFKALVGCYDGIQIAWGSGVAFPLASEILSDNCYGGGGVSDGDGYPMIDEFSRDRSAADQSLYEQNWIGYYKTVNRCNTLIGKMDQISWGSDQALRNIYESETRFIRAFAYFDMVRLWGNIPLLISPSAENLPQANPDDVYKVIAEDLKFAAENLPATTYSGQSRNDFGRVTKWAAEALLARVYLYYTGYYGKTDLVGVVNKAQALSNLEDIISNGGYSLLSDFSRLWPASLDQYAGEHNSEIIYSIRFTYTSDYDGNTDGNHWMIQYGLRGTKSYPYGEGWGGATVNAKLWNAFANNDTRKTASILSIADEHIAFTKQSDQKEYTGYNIKKYIPLIDENGNSLATVIGGTDFMIGQYQDYYSIRYSDVLLMAAELGSPNAQTYFDNVRMRAYKSAFTPLTVTPENILRERQLEFAFEGIRYWDLLRQGIDQAAQTISESTTVLTGGTPSTKTISVNKILETKGLQQIPGNQITLSNGVLKQNAGW